MIEKLDQHGGIQPAAPLIVLHLHERKQLLRFNGGLLFLFRRLRCAGLRRNGPGGRLCVQPLAKLFQKGIGNHWIDRRHKTSDPCLTVFGPDKLSQGDSSQKGCIPLTGFSVHARGL